MLAVSRPRGGKWHEIGTAIRSGRCARRCGRYEIQPRRIFQFDRNLLALFGLVWTRLKNQSRLNQRLNPFLAVLPLNYPPPSRAIADKPFSIRFQADRRVQFGLWAKAPAGHRLRTVGATNSIIPPQPKSDISDLGHLRVPNSGKPEFGWGGWPRLARPGGDFETQSGSLHPTRPPHVVRRPPSPSELGLARVRHSKVAQVG